MNDVPIAIPQYVADHVLQLRCRYCLKKLRPSGVVAAGVRRTPSYRCSFAVSVNCRHCNKVTETFLPEQPLSPLYWAKQIADATPRKCRRRGRAKSQQLDLPKAEEPVQLDEDESPDERPEYYAVEVCLLDCAPGNFDHATGAPASVVTIGKNDMSVEPLVFTIEDTKNLAVKALVSLATYDDRFAQRLLDDFFAADDQGRFIWPSEPYDLP